jgi:hypothetical protein
MMYYMKYFNLFVLFQLLIYGCGNYSSNENTLDENIRPFIELISPSDGVSSVSTDTTISVTFTESMDSTSVTTNTSDTSCSGTLQVSSDNFSSCIQMSSTPSNSNSNKTYTVTPSSRLTYGTNYKVGLTNRNKGTSGKTLSSQYTTPTGFTSINITVSSTSPSDSESSVSVSTSISITLSKPVDTSTVTTNTSNTSCSGSFQVSSDNFSSCVRMSSSPSSSNTDKTFTITPSDNLSYSTTYKIRVTTGVKDTSENTLSSQWTQPNGFVSYNWSGTQQLGTSSDDWGRGVTVDSSDNIYVTGYTWGGLDGNTNSGSWDLFLVKYNSSGVKQWTKQLGTSSGDQGYGVTVDSSDNLYVTGWTQRGLDGNTYLGGDANGGDIFLVKYNSSGVKQWTRQWGSSSDDWGNGVTVDSSNNIYMTGYTNGGLDGNTNSGSTDIFLVKYNSSGTKQWTQQLGTSSSDYGYGVTADSSNNIYVTGYTYGGLDGNTSSGSTDIILVKYNSSGTKQWTQQLGTSSDDRGEGVTVDSSNNIYVTGRTKGGLDGNTNSGGGRPLSGEVQLEWDETVDPTVGNLFRGLWVGSDGGLLRQHLRDGNDRWRTRREHPLGVF